MDILQNELIKKYFGDHDSRSQERRSNWAMAYKVLSSMQEPIKKGDRALLLIDTREEVEEFVVEDDKGGYPNHWRILRLPDKFQKRECKYCGASLDLGRKEEECKMKPKDDKRECCEYHSDRWRNNATPGKVIPWCGENKTPPLRDAVEETVKAIANAIKTEHKYLDWEMWLRDLVRLAKERVLKTL